MTLLNDNKLALILLVLVIVGLLTLIAFSVVTQGVGLELIDSSTMRYCSLSGGVCTGV